MAARNETWPPSPPWGRSARILGGLMFFGAMGFILGPILAALFVTAWEVFGTAFRTALAEPGAAEDLAHPCRGTFRTAISVGLSRCAGSDSALQANRSHFSQHASVPPGGGDTLRVAAAYLVTIKSDDQSPFPGRLFIVEGIDGSGKSTQVSLLQKWLELEGYGTYFSEWNSSPLVGDVTRRGKKKRMLTPMTFSLIHATDFADRSERHIIPPLKAGAIVLADRYAYTAFARDVARGVDARWVRNLYRFAVTPTIAFYFRISADEALNRIVGNRDAISYYEAGVDRTHIEDREKSFRVFQGSVIEEYDRMVDEFGLVVIDARQSIKDQQVQMREAVAQALPGVPTMEPRA